jgi:hypothetical protein
MPETDHAVRLQPLSLEPEKAPIAAIIGLACLLGSATLAWLSSPATLQLTRDNEDRVSAAVEARLCGLITTRAARIDGIRSVSLVKYNGPGQRSDTPDRLVFETTAGAVDLGRNQQLFAVDYPEIASFLATHGPAAVTLSSIGRGRELRRFVFAQMAALFLCFAGLGLEWMVVQSLRT